MEFIKRNRKHIIIVVASAFCIVMFVVGTVLATKAKTKTEQEKTAIASDIEVVNSNLVENPVVVSQVKVDSSTASETDNEIIKPIDCHEDFWAVKYGIAECYDHIFKKGHMEGRIYYQGDCTKHDPKEINELARKVKLYRGDDESYTATLPEIDWTINIYDEKIHEIINAQIEGEGPAYKFDEVSIVMYYSSTDNTLMIETVREE